MNCWRKGVIKSILKRCYPEYSIIFDGILSFAEYKIVKLRAVVKQTFQIVEILVQIKLFDIKNN